MLVFKWFPRKWKIAVSPFPRQSIHLFICWFIYLPRLDGGSDLLSEACNECRTKVDAGRRSNQRQDLERDIHMDYTRVFGKWAIKQRAELNAGSWVCLHSCWDAGGWLQSSSSPKKHVNASQPHLNRVIFSSDDFWYAVFLIIHCVRLFSIPGSPGRSMSTMHPVSAMTWRYEKGHYESN